MTNELYKAIDVLTLENGELKIQLFAAEKELGALKVEVKRLEDGALELSVKLEDLTNENARLVMVTNHRVETMEHLKRNPLRKD
jgi:predicted  nucleic acid-binding Zn-ribbon protein